MDEMILPMALTDTREAIRKELSARGASGYFPTSVLESAVEATAKLVQFDAEWREWCKLASRYADVILEWGVAYDRKKRAVFEDQRRHLRDENGEDLDVGSLDVDLDLAVELAHDLFRLQALRSAHSNLVTLRKTRADVVVKECFETCIQSFKGMS